MKIDQQMRKHVFDWHLTGLLGGITFSGAVGAYSAVMGAVAITATAAYGCLRFWRYSRKVEPAEK